MVSRWGRWWRWGWLLALAVTPALAAAETNVVGGIRGRVADADDQSPVGLARVTVVEALLSTMTTADGLFRFTQVPPGNYTLSVARDGYTRKVIPNVVVTAGRLAEVAVDLAPEIYEMEEMVVRGFDLDLGTQAALLEVRQEMAGLTDAIGADLIGKAGASTAAAALRLVVGTSVVDGKYVVIRGLGDRYTSSTLNGMRIPTADADKRAVQMDQFPAAQIENITVYKTFTPDLQGEASGGAVNIKTKSIPDRRFLNFSAGVEYNTQTTGNDEFLTYRGGGTGYWGVDDGARKVPLKPEEIPGYQGATLNPVIASNRLPNAQLLDRQTRAFTPVMGTSRESAPLNHSWSLGAGDRLKLANDHQLGWLAAFSYRHKYSYYTDGTRDTIEYNGYQVDVKPVTSFQDSRGTEEVQWNVSAGLGYQPFMDHELKLMFSHNQTTTDEARILEGINFEQDANRIQRSQSLRYNERALQTWQLAGDHKIAFLDNLELDWRGVYSTTKQYEPDQRFFRSFYDPLSGVEETAGSDIQSTLRVWRDIQEDNRQGALNLKRPFRQWSGTEGYLKAGWFADRTHRDFTLDSFTYLFPPQVGPFSNPARQQNNSYSSYRGPGLWTDVFLEPHRIGLATNGAPAINQVLWHISRTSTDVDYTGEQNLDAFYLMGELPLAPWFKLVGGVRWETTDLAINIQSPRGFVQTIYQTPDGNYGLVNTPDAEAGSQLRQTDLLPALSLNWELRPKLFLRAAWSRTIARPTFRELAPVRTFEFLGSDTFIGNSDLQITHVENWDLRLEWFRRPGDVLAVSAFHKTIEDPIDRVGVDISGNRFVRPVNYPHGKLSGLEAEARLRLDVVHRALTNFIVNANATYLLSEVELAPEERSGFETLGIPITSRAMVGQPEYLVNLNLTYDNPRSGTAIGLFYVLTGPTLVVGGSSNGGKYVPDIVEAPVASLDASLEQKIGKHWKVTLRAKNLTDPVIRRYYDVEWGAPIDHSTFKRGRDFSIAASCSW